MATTQLGVEPVKTTKEPIWYRLLIYYVKAFQIAMIALIVMGMVVAGQVAQFYASSTELRSHAISQWDSQSNENKQLSQQFISSCLEGNQIRANNDGDTLERLLENNNVLTLEECANALGAQELYIAIQDRQASITSMAWPSSLFFD